MDQALRGKRSPTKVIAALLAALLLFQEVAQGASGGNFASEGFAPLGLSDLKHPPHALPEGIFSRLELPEELGKVNTVYSGTSEETIIHIQDLHINEAAQLKIAKIIEHIVSRYGVQLIQIEGASGELPHKLLSHYPQAKARQLAARTFLKEGMITGPEYFAIAKNPDLILYGIENKELYDQNRQALLDALKLADGLQPALSPLKKNIKALAGLIFRKETRSWLEKRAGFQSGELSISTYTHFLEAFCAAEKINCPSPQIALLFKMELLEEKARTEGQFNNEEELGVYLSETLKKEGGLNENLFLEIKAIEKKLEAHALTQPAAKRLYKLIRILEVYEQMFALSLNRESVEFLYQNREDFSPAKINWVIKDLANQHRLELDRRPVPFQKLEETLRAYEKFYELALRRDHELISGATESLKSHGKKISILVTGGFHTPAIEQSFKKSGISFCTIMPVVTERIDFQKDQKLYFKAMQLPQSSSARFTSAQDPALQLQIPSRLQDSAHLTDMALMIAATGLRLTEAKLSLQEAPADGIYQLFQSPGILINPAAGTAFVPYSSQAGLGLGLRWKSVIAPESMTQNPRKKSFSFVTPDKTLTEIQILGKELSEQMGKNFKRASVKIVKRPVKTSPEFKPAPKLKKAGFAKQKTSFAFLRILQKRASIKNVLEKLRSELRCGFEDSTGPMVKDGEEFSYDEEFLRTRGAALYPKNFFKPDPAQTVYGAKKKKKSGLAKLFHWVGTDGASALPREALKGIGASTYILSARGTQSYGGQLTLEDKDGNVIFLFFKDVNPKRSVLYKRLMQDLEHEIEKAKRNGFRVIDGYSDYSSHLRFATGSVSTPEEAHPHLSPENRKTVYNWKDARKKIQSQKRYIQVSGRHNGDEDGVRLAEEILIDHPFFSFAKKMGKDEIRSEFNRMLYKDFTKGDSPVIVSLLALFITQGRWDAAARFAYLTLSGSLKESFAGVDDPLKIDKIIEVWGSVFDEIFKQHINNLFIEKDGKWVPDAGYIDTVFLPVLLQKVKNDGRIKNDEYLQSIVSSGKIEDFVETALYAFLNQDTNRAIEMLLATTMETSTFGLSISYTLEPRTKFWVTKGQPGAIGYNPNTRRFVAASDPAAVWGSLNSYSHFLTLNEADGEIARLDMSNRNGEDGTRAPILRIFSMAKHRDLTDEEIRARWVPVGNNPYIELPRIPRDDENNMKTDLAELNDVMLKVTDGFHPKHRNNSNLPSNRLTADNFNRTMLEIANSRRKQTAARVTVEIEAREAKAREWRAQVDSWAHQMEAELPPHFLIVASKDDLALARDKAESIKEKIPQAKITIRDSQAFLNQETELSREVQQASEASHRIVTLTVQNKTVDPYLTKAKRRLETFQANTRLNWTEEPLFDEHKVEEADLVFVAEGPSYYLLKRKAEDLKAFVPGLKIQVIHGNDYMTHLDAYYSGEGVPFKIGANTVLFPVTESGMTFSEAFTGQHAKIMKAEGKLKDVFIMTNEWFSILGRTTGQQYFPDSKFDGHIFSNMAGRRYSEASTMASATDFFLAKMFLDLFHHLAEAVPQNSGEPRPFGLNISDQTLYLLENNLDALPAAGEGLPSKISEITGTGAGGVSVKSKVNQAHLAEGQNRANYISENYVIGDVLVGLTRLYGLISGVLHLGIFKFLAFVITFIALIIVGFEHVFTVIQNFPALEIGGVVALFAIATIADIIVGTWPDKIFKYVLRVLQNRETRHSYDGSRNVIIGGVHAELLRAYNRNALLEAQKGLKAIFHAEDSEEAGDFMHYFKDPDRGDIIDISISDDEHLTEAQERKIDGWKMTMSQSYGVQSLAGGPRIVITTTNSEKSYKFKHLNTGTDETPKNTETAFLILNARWISDLKLLVAGQVRAAEMADALARARFSFYVRRSEAWHQYALEAFFKPLAWVYAKYAIYLNAQAMKKLFRAVPNYIFLFITGHGLSGAKVFSTQTIPPKMPKPEAEAPRDTRKIAAQLAEEGIDETTWIPKPRNGKPSIMSRILAELYNPADERKPGPGDLTGPPADRQSILEAAFEDNGHLSNGDAPAEEVVEKKGWAYVKKTAEAGPAAAAVEVVKKGWGYKKVSIDETKNNGDATLSELRVTTQSQLEAALLEKGIRGGVKVKSLKSKKDFFEVFLVNVKSAEKPLRIVIFQNPKENRHASFTGYQSETFNYERRGITYKAWVLIPEEDLFLVKVNTFTQTVLSASANSNLQNLEIEHKKLTEESSGLKTRAITWPAKIDELLRQSKARLETLGKEAETLKEMKAIESEIIKLETVKINPGFSEYPEFRKQFLALKQRARKAAELSPLSAAVESGLKRLDHKNSNIESKILYLEKAFAKWEALLTSTNFIQDTAKARKELSRVEQAVNGLRENFQKHYTSGEVWDYLYAPLREQILKIEAKIKTLSAALNRKDLVLKNTDLLRREIWKRAEAAGVLPAEMKGLNLAQALTLVEAREKMKNETARALRQFEDEISKAGKMNDLGRIQERILRSPLLSEAKGSLLKKIRERETAFRKTFPVKAAAPAAEVPDKKTAEALLALENAERKDQEFSRKQKAEDAAERLRNEAFKQTEHENVQIPARGEKEKIEAEKDAAFETYRSGINESKRQDAEGLAELQTETDFVDAGNQELPVLKAERVSKRKKAESFEEPKRKSRKPETFFKKADDDSREETLPAIEKVRAAKLERRKTAASQIIAGFTEEISKALRMNQLMEIKDRILRSPLLSEDKAGLLKQTREKETSLRKNIPGKAAISSMPDSKTEKALRNLEEEEQKELNLLREVEAERLKENKDAAAQQVRDEDFEKAVAELKESSPEIEDSPKSLELEKENAFKTHSAELAEAELKASKELEEFQVEAELEDGSGGHEPAVKAEKISKRAKSKSIAKPRRKRNDPIRPLRTEMKEIDDEIISSREAATRMQTTAAKLLRRQAAEKEAKRLEALAEAQRVREQDYEAALNEKEAEEPLPQAEDLEKKIEVEKEAVFKANQIQLKQEARKNIRQLNELQNEANLDDEAPQNERPLVKSRRIAETKKAESLEEPKRKEKKPVRAERTELKEIESENAKAQEIAAREKIVAAKSERLKLAAEKALEAKRAQAQAKDEAPHSSPSPIIKEIALTPQENLPSAKFETKPLPVIDLPRAPDFGAVQKMTISGPAGGAAHTSGGWTHKPSFSGAKTSPAPRKSRPRIEVLEDRTVLSASSNFLEPLPFDGPGQETFAVFEQTSSADFISGLGVSAHSTLSFANPVISEIDRDLAFISENQGAPLPSGTFLVIPEETALKQDERDALFTGEKAGTKKTLETSGEEVVTLDSEGRIVQSIELKFTAQGISYRFVLSDFTFDNAGKLDEFILAEHRSGIFIRKVMGLFESSPDGGLKGVISDGSGFVSIEFKFETTPEVVNSPVGAVTEVVMAAKDGSEIKVTLDSDEDISYRSEENEAGKDPEFPIVSVQDVPAAVPQAPAFIDNSSSQTSRPDYSALSISGSLQESDDEEGYGPLPDDILNLLFMPKAKEETLPQGGEFIPESSLENSWSKSGQAFTQNNRNQTKENAIIKDNGSQRPADEQQIDWLLVTAASVIGAGAAYYFGIGWLEKKILKQEEEDEPAGVRASELRAAPQVKFGRQNGKHVLILALPPETGLEIHNGGSEPVKKLVLKKITPVFYETDDQSITATIDKTQKKIFFRTNGGSGHRLVEINDKKVTALIPELSVDLPPGIDAGKLIFNAAKVMLFLGIAGLLLTWLAPMLTLSTLSAAGVWILANPVTVLYWTGALFPAAMIILIFRKEKNDKTERISWSAWLGNWLSRIILLAAFGGAGLLLLYFQVAPLVFLTGFIWFMHSLFIIGALLPQTVIWLLTILSFPLRVIPGVARLSTLKQNLSAFLGIAVLGSTLYIGVSLSNNFSKTPDSRLNNISTALTTEPWPGGVKEITSGQTPEEHKGVYEHKGQVETFVFTGAVPLLPHKGGKLKVDPASKINPADWQKSNRAFSATAGGEHLFLEQEKDAKATQLTQFGNSVRSVNASLKRAEALGVISRAEGLSNSAAPLLLKIANYEDSRHLYRKVLVPGPSGDAVVFIPEENERALGTVTPTTVLGHAQSTRRLGFRTTVPAGLWRSHDLLRARAWVKLAGEKEEVSARIIKLEMDPRFDRQMNLTILLESNSKQPIFAWDFERNRPKDSEFRLVIPRRRQTAPLMDRLDSLPSSSLIRSYGVAGKHPRVAVNAPENIGHWELKPGILEGGWVRSKQRIIGMTKRDREALEALIAEGESYKAQAERQLRALKILIGQGAESEKSRKIRRETEEIGRVIIEINGILEKLKHLESLSPIDGFLAETPKTEGQLADGQLAVVIAPQILIPVEYEKRAGLEVKIGEFVKLVRPSGEFAYGRIHAVDHSVSNNGGRNPLRYGRMTVQTHNIPPHILTANGKSEEKAGFWIVDREPEIEIIYPPSSTTTPVWAAGNFLPLLSSNPWQQLGTLAAADRLSPQEWLAREYQKQESYLDAMRRGAVNVKPLPLFPVEFTEPPTEVKDLDRIREALRTLVPADPEAPEVSPRTLPTELAREQRGESEGNLSTSKNETILKIVHGSNEGRDLMKRFVDNKSIPLGKKVEEIEQVVLYGPADAGQIGLDYLYDQHQSIPLLRIHASLSKKSAHSPQLDMTKRAGLHLAKSIEVDKETLEHFVRIKDSDPESLEAKAAQNFLASLLVLPNAADDAKNLASAVRNALASEFWRTSADKLQLARALRNVKQDDPLFSRRRQAALLVESEVFAEIFSRYGLSHQSPEVTRAARWDVWTAAHFGLPGNWERYHGIGENHRQDQLFGHSHRAIGYFSPDALQRIINPEIYAAALDEFDNLKADAETQPAGELELFDLLPLTQGLRADHVFDRSDPSKVEKEYLPHLSLQARELFLNASDSRPNDPRYRDNRQQIYESLAKDNSPEARLILARRFLKATGPEDIKALADLKVDDLLFRELRRLKAAAVEHEPSVNILIFEHALARQSGFPNLAEGKRALALRRALDTYTDFELVQISRGAHPTANRIFTEAKVPERVLRTTARQLVSRNAALSALKQAALWNRDLSLKNQIITPDSPLYMLNRAYELDGLNAQRIDAEWRRGLRNNPRLFLRALELYEFRFKELNKGEKLREQEDGGQIVLVENSQIVPRDEVTRFEDWRLGLLFILGIPALGLGLGLGVAQLMRKDPLTRSELRTSPFHSDSTATSGLQQKVKELINTSKQYEQKGAFLYHDGVQAGVRLSDKNDEVYNVLQDGRIHPARIIKVGVYKSLIQNEANVLHKLSGKVSGIPRLNVLGFTDDYHLWIELDGIERAENFSVHSFKNIPEILAAFLFAARTLEALHQEGVVHNDVRPENLLINGAGQIQVNDFASAASTGDPRLRYGVKYSPFYMDTTFQSNDIYGFIISFAEVLSRYAMKLPSSEQAQKAAVTKIADSFLNLILERYEFSTEQSFADLLYRDRYFDLALDRTPDNMPQTMSSLIAQLRETADAYPNRTSSELRARPSGALIKALASNEKFRNQLRVNREVNLTSYKNRAIAADWNFEEVLSGTSAALKKNSPEIAGAGHQGEIILNYRAESHGDDFAAQWAAFMRNRPQVKRLTIFKDSETGAEAWTALKAQLEALPGFQSLRIVFENEASFEGLETYARKRLSVLKLSKDALVQILAPSKVKEQDRILYDDFLMGAAPLGEESLMILGSQQPMNGARHITIEEAIEIAFESYERIKQSA